MSDLTGETEAQARIAVRTVRLRLVALDAKLAALQVEDRAAFFDALGAEREAVWPPVAEDAEKLVEKRDILAARPEEAGWRGWVFLMGWTPGGRDRAVGAGGIFGPPNAAGEIEIGYAMAASFREQGLATEAVTGLLSWAFRDPRVVSVRAATLAHLAASRRVLEKTGFAEAGAGSAPGVVVYRRDAA